MKKILVMLMMLVVFGGPVDVQPTGQVRCVTLSNRPVWMAPDPYAGTVVIDGRVVLSDAAEVCGIPTR